MTASVIICFLFVERSSHNILQKCTFVFHRIKNVTCSRNNTYFHFWMYYPFNILMYSKHISPMTWLNLCNVTFSQFYLNVLHATHHIRCVFRTLTTEILSPPWASGYHRQFAEILTVLRSFWASHSKPRWGHSPLRHLYRVSLQRLGAVLKCPTHQHLLKMSVWQDASSG